MEISIKSLVIEINDAFEKGNTEFLAKHVTDDIVWTISGQNEPINGKAAYLECCKSAPFKEGSPKVTLVNVYIDGGSAVADGNLEAETLSGKAFYQRFCDIYHFDGDKIKEMTTYLDTAYDRAVL